MLVPVSDMVLLHELCNHDETNAINAIVLEVVIVTVDHVDKSAMDPENGAWIKNQYVLLAWIKKSAERLDSVKNNTAAELVKKWDDGKNEMFTLSPTSYKGSQFKTTNQFDRISNIPKFSELSMMQSCENNTFTECVTAPIVGTLYILLKEMPARLLPKYLRKFLDKHKNDTILEGMELWNPEMEKCIRVELAFFKKHMLQLFRALSDRDSLRNSFDN